MKDQPKSSITIINWPMVSVAEECRKDQGLRNASDLSHLKISTPTVIKLIETGYDYEACVSF